MTDLTVTTFFWQDDQRRRDYTFGPRHVHILKNMVERNLTIPHRFVCVTDDDVGDDIETVPLNWEKHVPGTCFIRLWQRSPDYPIKGRILNLDLDVVITGNIDEIVGRKEDCVWWRNPNYPMPGRAFYQTSIQLFDSGTHPELWNDFDPKKTTEWVNRRFGGAEQAWVSERLPWTEAYWDGTHGIYGAGRMFRDQMDNGVGTTLPDNARIVSFPGNRMPEDDDVQKDHPWVKDFYK